PREHAPRILSLCSFGVPAAQATETLALIGDSHATHWRPALDLVARAKGWHVENMTRTSCPFSTAPIDKSKALRRQCAQRNHAAAAAARELGPPRAQVIDLTTFQCSARFCFPVIGGVLVHKDIDHITRTFAETLAPYLLRGYDRLAAAWGASPGSAGR